MAASLIIETLLSVCKGILEGHVAFNSFGFDVVNELNSILGVQDFKFVMSNKLICLIILDRLLINWL